jgi:novobiocin biosynthesis protein NovU/D-mycarose 3-C-methyltransferase
MSLPRFPLNLCTCDECGFAQLDIAIDSKVLFEHYVYVTPNARSLQSHYDEEIAMIAAYPFKTKPLAEMNVVEMGSNNGAFLRAIRPHVAKVIGIDPAKNIVEQANTEGLPTIAAFLSEDTAEELRAQTGPADLLVARHCMAHLDDLRGTMRAIASMLADDGIVVIENAYLRSTLEGAQFDQLYHEHMSYFALRSLTALMASCGLYVRHAYVAPIHGGSIVVIASKTQWNGEQEAYFVTDEYQQIWRDEESLPKDLEQFAFMTRATVGGLRKAIEGIVHDGAVVYTYGATAKGNTLLNVTGLTHRDVVKAVDSTPIKQGRYLPGSGIEVISEEEAAKSPPSAYLLTAWNYAPEILAKNEAYRRAGGKFILPLPTPKLL